MKDGITLTPEEWDERIPLFAGVRQTSFCEFESVAKEHFVPVMGKSVFGGSLIAQSMEAMSISIRTDTPSLHNLRNRFGRDARLRWVLAAALEHGAQSRHLLVRQS